MRAIPKLTTPPEPTLEETRAEFMMEARYGFNDDNPSGANGWVQPDGKLMGCNYACHDYFCEMWYGIPETEIEKTHVKLSGSQAHFYGKRLTPRQIATLLDYGYDPESLAACGQSERRR